MTTPDPAVSPVAGTLDIVAGQILDYALLLAAIGTITMALLELVKALISWRKRFHRRRIERWLRAASDPQAVHDQLLLLAAGGIENVNVLYDQPTAKLLGQLQAAANVALDFPARYRDFYDFLTATPQSRDGVQDQRTWRAFSEARLSGKRRTAGDDGDARAAAQARARLGNLVARKLDALQNKIEYDWARYNQASSVISGALLLGAILLHEKPQMHAGMMMLLALTGGMVAPFAKNVVSALTGLRARRS